MQLTFITLIVLSGILTIWSKHVANILPFMIFKPLTMLLIISLLLFNWNGQEQYSFWILFGLSFSLAGDIFLMLSRKYFKYGLFAFLIAHIFYIYAFTMNVYQYNYLILSSILIYAVLMFLYLKNDLGSNILPVVFYIIMISFMLWTAVSRYLFQSDLQNLFVMVGGIIFVISDSVLAVNKFKKHLKFSEETILFSYYTAQVLFVFSAITH